MLGLVFRVRVECRYINRGVHMVSVRGLVLGLGLGLVHKYMKW